MKIVNILSILGLLADTIVRFSLFNAGEAAPTDPFYYLLTIYMIPFCVLLICAELKWTRVLKYVQFLGYQHGKGLFFIFIALLLFDTDHPLDAITSVIVTFVGIFNMITACIVPGLNHLSFLKFSKEKASDDEEEYESDETDENDSDIDPHEHDSLLPGSVNYPTKGESADEERLGVDSDAPFKMGRFVKTKSKNTKRD